MEEKICKCENCGKEFKAKSKQRFCSILCTRSYATKNLDHNKLKYAKCIQCGKGIQVKINTDTSKCKCEDCKRKTLNKKCKVCGTLFNGKYDKHCPNTEFCNKKSRIIKTLIKYFGFDKTKVGTQDVFQEYERVRKQLYNDIWTLNLTSGQICEKYNYPHVRNINKVFESLNIKMRNLSEAIKLNYLNNRINQKTNNFHGGWHKTWDNKDVYLRSSYETDYANMLDKKEIKYEVESLRIKYLSSKDNEYHCAIPDFYLPDTNTIIEIKSLYTLDIQEIQDKFKAYHEQSYNTKLILEHQEVNLYNLENEIDSESYYKIIRQYKPKYHMIKGTYCWITKNGVNKKCSINDFPLYNKKGWKRGRTL